MGKFHENMFNLFKRYTLADAKMACKDYSVKRSSYRIIVIDDKGFPLLNGLKASGFNIDHLYDIDNIYTLQPYDIVVCDIRGVGKAYGSIYEGAFIIKEIRTYYPEKYVILHSGSTFKTSFNDYFQLCDLNIRKGTDLGDWVEHLDNICRDIANPEKEWDRMKVYFSAQKVPLKILDELETSFSKAIVKRDHGQFKKVATNGMKKFSSEALKIIVESITNQIIRNITNR